jgi:hypothetical protein
MFFRVFKTVVKENYLNLGLSREYVGTAITQSVYCLGNVLDDPSFDSRQEQVFYLVP